jgi:hypothetical protein
MDDPIIPERVLEHVPRTRRNNGGDPIPPVNLNDPSTWRRDTPCTVWMAAIVAKRVVHEERWYRRLVRWWRRRFA